MTCFGANSGKATQVGNFFRKLNQYSIIRQRGTDMKREIAKWNKKSSTDKANERNTKFIFLSIFIFISNSFVVYQRCFRQSILLFFFSFL